MNADIFALLLKVSVILGMAALVAMLLRGSSAARRHFVWSAAITSTLVLVVLQSIVPPFVVPVQQHSMFALVAHASTGDITSSAVLTSRGVPAVLSTAPALPYVVSPSSERTGALSTLSESATDSRRLQTGMNAAAVSPEASARATEHQSVVNVASAADGASALASLPEQLRPMLLGAWLLGSLLLLTRWVMAHWRLRQISRSSDTIVDSALRDELQRLGYRLGLHKSVRLLVHQCVATPCTAGSRNPVILLPQAFREWSTARREAVFTHELAHIARGDSMAQNVAAVACALFWYHPGFWLAARMLRVESERAADDCVIRSGMAPVDYANHLLAIAEVSSGMQRIPVVALGMARASQLELRLRAMLSGRQSRSSFTRGSKRVFGTAVAMVVVPLASVQARVQDSQPRPKVAPPAIPVSQLEPAKPARAVAAPSVPVPVAPANVKLSLPVVPPTVQHRAMQLPAAPVKQTVPNQGAYVGPAPRKDSTSKPLPPLRRTVPPAVDAASDSVVDRTISVSRSDILNLNIESFAELVFHPSSESFVRVRAVTPREFTIGQVVKLTRIGNGAEFRVYNERELKNSRKLPRYEVWLPISMSIFVQPSSDRTINQLTISGLKNATGIKEIHIDGAVTAPCAAAIFAHVVGHLQGKLICGPFAFPTVRYEKLRVIVDGVPHADSVLTLNGGWYADLSSPKPKWKSLPGSQYDPDSISMSFISISFREARGLNEFVNGGSLFPNKRLRP